MLFLEEDSISFSQHALVPSDEFLALQQRIRQAFDRVLMPFDGDDQLHEHVRGERSAFKKLWNSLDLFIGLTFP